MENKDLKNIISSGESTDKMPVLFIGHGSPELAFEVKQTVSQTVVGLDEKWGLDYNKSSQSHYNLAKELALFKRKGVLIIGSGNLVHNLGRIVWDHASDPEFGFEWDL